MTQKITSTRNPMVAHVQRLRRRGRRSDAGVTPIEGIRVLERAADAGVQISTLFVCPERIGGGALEPLSQRLGQRAGKVIEVSPEVADRMAYGGREGDLLALVQTDPRGLPEPDGDGPIIVLDQVEKPGNVGAVLRSADAAGASAVVCSSANVDPWNPNLLRASEGAAFTIPFGAASRKEVGMWLQERAVGAVVATPDAESVYTGVDLRGRVAVVLGSEHAGIEANAWPSARECRIPQLGSVDSLNVSVAAAVFLFEALRQRGGDGLAGTDDLG